MPHNPIRRPPMLRDLLVSGPLALFLDFDGTLVDIAPTPDAIIVPSTLPERLAVLAEALDGRLAVVSGRGIADIERHCGPLAVAIAGSHGADVRMADGAGAGPAIPPLPPAVVNEVAAYALSHSVDFERKPHGAALHSRVAPEKEAQALAFMEDLARRHGLDTKRGKSVVELVHSGTDKGGAVDAFMAVAPFIGARPVFIGDDVTDEDGFAACARRGGFGIAIGDRPSASARYRLAGPAALHEWMQL